MKKDIHPQYRPVVFHDLSADQYIIVSSTIEASDTIDIDGATYPLVRLDVSSVSHPYYTGKRNIVDSTGRVDRFKQLAERAAKKKEARANAKKKSNAKKSTNVNKKTLADLAETKVA